MSSTEYMENVTAVAPHDVYPFIDPKTTLSGSQSNRTILITGGGRGIGKAIAEAFVHAGATTMILTGRNESSLSSTRTSLLRLKPSTKVFTHATDVSSSTSVASLFTEIKAGNLGGKVPDVLVHNAGVMEKCLLLGDSEVDEWWSTWETNVKSTYLLAREYVKLLDGKKGVLVNTSSVGAFRTDPTVSAYQTSKTAVSRLTEFIDKEYASRGLKAVSYHPGGIKTDMVTTAFAALGDDAHFDQNFLEMFIDTPELAGAVCVYLATERSDYLAGRYVSGNWDLEELEKRKEEIVKKDLLKFRMLV